MSAQLAAAAPTIKILFYTDDPQVAISDRPGELLGIGSMVQRLHAHAPAFAKLETTLINRNDTAHADNKLDVVLNREAQTGKPFDEIWFFGLHQANIATFSVGAFRGGPNSELDANEVAALNQWMSTQNGSPGGGILMTGDHSSPPPFGLVATPNSPCGDTSNAAPTLTLGRAIGRCVPRAGALRRWEGPPTTDLNDSFNTANGAELDRFPQQLSLRSVNADGDPDDNGQPHPLFFYKPNQYIRVFPDHTHEGAVVIPQNLDPQVWPSGPGGQVRPQVVALGADPRRADPLNIIATYNGDLAGVGRIVADSTWHHYMNLNLRGFPHPAPIDSESDQIGQFYANLAIWLAPRSKRMQMAHAMGWELARYTLLLENTSDLERLGREARSLIEQVASPCELHELMQLLARPPQSATGGLNERATPDQRLYLGFFLDQYHQAMIQAEIPEADETAPTALEDLIRTAYQRTLDEQARRLNNTLETVNAARNR